MLILLDVSLEEEITLTSVRAAPFKGHLTSPHPISSRKQLLQVCQPRKYKLRPLLVSKLTAELLVEQETVTVLHR